MRAVFIAVFIVWGLLFLASGAILRRSRDAVRTSWILLGIAAVTGVFLALRGSGYDPIPSFLVGQMIGSALGLMIPIAAAVALDFRRRRTKTE